jgi:formate dehydrogenase iron-sulfur subunit
MGSALPKGSGSPERESKRLPIVQKYLDEQQRLTAVERFAQRHDRHALEPGQRVYRELLPRAQPGPGEQLSFQVDLDACTGCKACVTACHALNGLDAEEGETWRTVGLLHGGSAEAPVQQTVTTACHHCVDPACMKGCPVAAYEKDPRTGIVKHLDDQCIGCQYCTLTCPYEVPKFSKKRGIVRKCDLCSERLAIGEAPACVQACPNEAIAIRVVSTAKVVEDSHTNSFLPGAPSPNITVPTTSYQSRRALPRNVLPADFHVVRSSPSHPPLVVLLVLTQLSVGAFVTQFVLDGVGRSVAFARPCQALLGLAAGLSALFASVFHLGRPRYAFRALLGLRTSWMSREALSFGIFAACAAVYTGSFWLARALALLGVAAPPEPQLEELRSTLAVAVALSGLAGVFCSTMVYHVTSRSLWDLSRTALRFALSCCVLGLSTASLALLGAALTGHDFGVAQRGLVSLSGPLVVFALLKLGADAQVLVHARDRGLGELKRTALLLLDELRPVAELRVGFGALGAALTFVAAQGPALGPGGWVALIGSAWACLLLGELCERVLFFRAVSAPKMPGAIGAP